jgi:hypothetical protein
MVNAVARRIYGDDSLFWGHVTEFGRMEKLSRMECHNVTNRHISINFEKKIPYIKMSH